MKCTKTKRILISLLISSGFLARAETTVSEASATLLVNVLNQEGRPVRDLTKENLRIKINGRPAVVIDAGYSVAPRRIVAVLDMSGSMRGQAGDKRWQIAREATEDLMTETPRDVSVALLTFSDQVHDVFDFSQSRNSMMAWLREGTSKKGQEDPRVRGRTALFDALLAASKMFGPVRAGDAIYVITDAGENSSHISKRALYELLLKSHIRLFMFLLSDQAPIEMREGKDSLKEIARATGGFAFGVAGHNRGIEFMPSWTYAFDFNEQTRAKIKLYTQALNIQVNGFYTVHVDLPIAPEKARNLSLEIVDGSGKQRKDVAYTYSTGLLSQAK